MAYGLVRNMCHEIRRQQAQLSVAIDTRWPNRRVLWRTRLIECNWCICGKAYCYGLTLLLLVDYIRL